MMEAHTITNISELHPETFFLMVNNLHCYVMGFLLERYVNSLLRLIVRIKTTSDQNDSYATVKDILDTFVAGLALPSCWLFYNTYSASNGSSAEAESPWFQGRVLSISPVLATGSGVVDYITLDCSGKASDLMFNFLTDFNYVSANWIDTRLTSIAERSLGNISAITGGSNFGKTKGLNIRTQMCKGQLPSKDTIALLLSKACNTLYNWVVDAELLPADLRSLFSILDYFTSDYKLGSLLKNSAVAAGGTKTNQLVPMQEQLNNGLLSGIMSSTVYLAIMHSITNSSLLLRTIPLPMGTPWYLGKLKIAPAYLQQFDETEGCTIKAKNIETISLFGNNGLSLRTPDVLFVKFGNVSDYGTKAGACYGRYPKRGLETDKKTLRVQTMQAPDWILSAVSQTMKQNRDLSIAKKNLILDDYAKAYFYMLYCKDKAITLNVINDAFGIHIDKYIGTTVCVDLLDILNNATVALTWQTTKYYGVMTGVTYNYRAPESAGDNTELHIQVHIDGVACGDAAQLYTTDNGLDGIFYLKV